MDLKQLFEQAGLPTDFSQKAEVLFTSALTERVALEVAEQTQAIQEASNKKLDEAKQEFIEEQTKSIDTLVESVIVEWIDKNSAALDTKIKSEVLESLVANLKESFNISGVAVPDVDQTAILESANTKALDYETKFKEANEKLAEATLKLELVAKADIVAELTEGLSDVATDRVVKLSEGLKGQDVETFRKSVEILAEAFGAKKADETDDDATDDDESDDGKDPGVDDDATDDDKKAEKEMKEQTNNSAPVDPLIEATLRLFNRNK